MTRLKALSVLQTRDYVLDKHGETMAERIRAELSPEAQRELYQDQLVTSDWIDVATAVEYLMAFDRVVGNGDGRTAAKLVARSAAVHFKGIYRVMFAFTSPRTAIEKGARVWNRFYDRGESRAELQDDYHVRLTITGCPDMPKHHELLILPYSEEMLRCAGAKDVKSAHVQCVANGAPVCITEMSWK
jgi:hypothetical protein